jgi:hypothetical protein
MLYSLLTCALLRSAAQVVCGTNQVYVCLLPADMLY